MFRLWYTVTMKTEHVCDNPHCSNVVLRTASTVVGRVFCCRACCTKTTKGEASKRRPMKGAEQSRWKGGRVQKNGYWLAWKPEHCNADDRGYVLEHRMVMSDFIGRPLKSDEHVHHKNKDKSDNRIENLELLSPSEHISLHAQEKVVGWARHNGHCADCGTSEGKHYAIGLCRNCYNKQRMAKGRADGYIAPSRRKN